MKTAIVRSTAETINRPAAWRSYCRLYMRPHMYLLDTKYVKY